MGTPFKAYSLPVDRTFGWSSGLEFGKGETMANSSAALLFKHRRLLFRVTRNELASRYAGSLLGIGWAVLAPLLIISIYAMVYLIIFRVQVPGLSPASYVVYVFRADTFLATSEAISLGYHQ